MEPKLVRKLEAQKVAKVPKLRGPGGWVEPGYAAACVFSPFTYSCIIIILVISPIFSEILCLGVVYYSNQCKVRKILYLAVNHQS